MECGTKPMFSARVYTYISVRHGLHGVGVYPSVDAKRQEGLEEERGLGEGVL